jgi:hypothetical protein
MIRTAEEIIDNHIGPYSVTLPKYMHEAYKKALNEARIEVIRECAEIATYCGENPAGVNSEAILELLDQIK